MDELRKLQQSTSRFYVVALLCQCRLAFLATP